VRTDMILSAEIMAIAMAEVAARPVGEQAAILALVGVAITIAVYGAVGLIVKMDDIGLHLAKGRGAALRAMGRGLVRAMPVVLAVLASVGTAAMLWVGGGILLHGAQGLGFAGPAHVQHEIAQGAGPALGWLVSAAVAGLVGILAGVAVVGAVHGLPAMVRRG
jgi:predicted DNA repair protein MutK